MLKDQKQIDRLTALKIAHAAAGARLDSAIKALTEEDDHARGLGELLLYRKTLVASANVANTLVSEVA